MDRRLGFIGIVLIFVFALVGFYIFLKKQQNKGFEPITAVPVNAALVIEIKKPLAFYHEIVQKNNLYKKLRQLIDIEKNNSNLNEIDTIIKNNPKLLNLFTKKPLLISLHDTGNSDFQPLFIIPLGGKYESNKLIKSIETECKNQYTISSERYNQIKVYKILKESKPFYYCYHKGLFLGSPSEILLKDAIRQAESTSNLLANVGLNRLIETSGKHAEANIYIQFKHFENYLGKVISDTYIKNQSIAQIGDWIELDLNLKNETLLLNGFAFSDDAENRFMNLFQGQAPQSIKFLKFIPANLQGFWGFGLSNYSLYKQNLRKYMERMGELDRFELNNKKVREVFGDHAETELEAIFRNELVQVLMPDASSLFYIKTQGFRDGTDLLTKWLRNYAAKNNESIEMYIKNFAIDKESHFPIYKMPIDYLPTRLFGPYFKTCQANYATVFDDYIIFGDSYDAVSKIIYNNVLQKTLAYNGAYSQFSDYLSNRVNFFGFISLIGTEKVLQSRMNPKAFSYYKENQELFHDFYAIAWQFAAENNMYYNNLLFRYQPSSSLKSATQWETRLDTLIAFKPEIMVNHLSREKEIFVQDEKNNIYLINNSGRILWKKNIEAPIMGEVFQVDYYKNGKLQYLFNTKTKIHLLDRNGNFVERYPITLASAAAAPLSVFDYENNKNYRLFIPLESKKVQVYNIEGKIVPGFKFNGSDNRIISPIQYVRDNNKDYIIITDESRIYILDRQGNNRVNPKIQFNPSIHNKFEYQKGNNTRAGRLVRTDEKGTVYYIYFNGEVELKNIQECTPNHFFNVEDVTGDNVNDFIFIEGNELSVYGLTGDKLYTHKFSTNIKHKPSFYRFSSNKTYVGITETDAHKIYLFNTSGKILEGFPLTGKTRFSIGFLEPGSDRFNLVVGGDEYYLYNFKLN